MSFLAKQHNFAGDASMLDQIVRVLRLAQR
jgi:hypothetical protein